VRLRSKMIYFQLTKIPRSSLYGKGSPSRLPKRAVQSRRGGINGPRSPLSPMRPYATRCLSHFVRPHASHYRHG
jgi:hypothetical protein